MSTVCPLLSAGETPAYLYLSTALRRWDSHRLSITCVHVTAFDGCKDTTKVVSLHFHSQTKNRMQAIILAAGMGERLGEYTRDNTKCMIEVGGVRLIDRALSALKDANVSRVVVVVGYKGHNVIDHLGHDFQGMPIEYVENTIYDKTNNIYSLYLAKDYMLADDTILLESDIIFEPSVVKKIIHDECPNIALVDKYESWMDGTVVTLDDQQHIVRLIDKSQFDFNNVQNYYKTVNIYKFSRSFSAKYYVPFLEAYSTALGNNEYYEQVLRIILHLRNLPLKALPLDGEMWYEIDDAQDLDIASGMFEPSEDERYHALVSRYGGYWRYPQMLDFCYLVNPFFPPKRMVDEMKTSFETLMREYPSGMRVNSLLAAKNFGVRQDFILVGNGAAELIKTLVEKWSGCLGYIAPSFEEYATRANPQSTVCFVSEKDGFRYTAGDVAAFFDNKKIDTLLLINPDNPSGNFIAYDDLLTLVEWTKKKGVRFIVDESFVDFADASPAQTLFNNALLSANKHLVVVKSISKSYGVPGLRLGVLASGDTDMISQMKKQVAIWNINSFGEFFMQVFGKYRKDYAQACTLFKAERRLFLEELRQISYLTVYPSEANYFLCRVNNRFTSHELALLLLRHDILIKDCGTKNAFNGDNYIRIAVRDRSDNHKLYEVLKSL